MSTGMQIIRAEGALLVSFYLFYNIILFQLNTEVTSPEIKIKPPTNTEQKSDKAATESLQLKPD
jgi:hypothetical protein